MPRVRSSLCGVALVLGLGCEPAERDERPSAPAEVEATPDALFPLAIGDRWRERIGESGARTRGITAHTLEGHAVMFGQADRRPAFYRADAQEAALVDPSGRVLEPLLRAPIRAGARFEYELGEGPTAASCTAAVVETGARTRVSRTPLEGCVRVERRCTHPPGLVFEVETTRRVEETYCPGVGRVRTRQTLEPPLAGAEGVQTVELIGYRIAGAPAEAPPATLGCDGVLLLPSDVQAACGPEWTFAGEETLADGCVHRFTAHTVAAHTVAAHTVAGQTVAGHTVAGTDEAAEGVLELRVSRRPDEAAAAAALDALLAAGQEGAPAGDVRVSEREGGVSLGATEGAHVVLVQTSGCPSERAARLVPFVRSLLAP